jgi:hypothetical protein
MSATNTALEKWSALSGGAVLGAAVLAFFSTPFIPFANPVILLAAGIFLGFAVLGVYNVNVVPGVDKNMNWFALVCFIIGLACLVFAVVPAALVSSRIDETCLSLQKEMFEGQSADHVAAKASAPHDAFAALRCRPQ